MEDRYFRLFVSFQHPVHQLDPVKQDRQKNGECNGSVQKLPRQCGVDKSKNQSAYVEPYEKNCACQGEDAFCFFHGKCLLI